MLAVINLSLITGIRRCERRKPRIQAGKSPTPRRVGLLVIRLMIEQELFRVDQGPDDIFVGDLHVVLVFFNVGHRDA